MRTLEKNAFSRVNNYYVDTTPDTALGCTLENDIDTHTVIIGGGYGGLDTAMSLMERNHTDVVLLEAERIGFGASGRNGGFVFGGFSRHEKDLFAQLGPEMGYWAYHLTTQAIELMRKRINRYNIKCDAAYSGVILANWFNDTRALKARQQFMQQALNVQWDWMDQDTVRKHICTERYFNGLFEPNAFHIHPLKYAQGLAQTLNHHGIRLFENTPALKITALADGRIRVITPQGSVLAQNAVIACGGYIHGFYPPLARAILPISTYVMVTEPLGERLDALIPTQAAIYDTRFAFDYYRKLPDKRLLWGGRISIKQRNPKALQRLLLRDLLRVFPSLHDVRIDYAWGGLMAYARHQMPIIGQTHSKIWHLIGFGGHGVAPTTAGGELIAQAICGENEHYTRLARYGADSAFGHLGQLFSQCVYWKLQMNDWLNEKRFNGLR